MPKQIICKQCHAKNCFGCNAYRLVSALNNGKLDWMKDEHNGIQIRDYGRDIKALEEEKEHYRMLSDEWYHEATEIKGELVQLKKECDQTVFGYNKDALIAFAFLCRKNNVAPEDMQQFAQNIQAAYSAVKNEIQMCMYDMLKVYGGDSNETD